MMIMMNEGNQDKVVGNFKVKRGELTTRSKQQI